METLSNTKIENILSLTGNNKCFECDSPEVDWVSFPASVFICHNCGRRHKEFKFKPCLKSLSVSEFSQHEIKKMNLGGNARYHTLMDEYKISMKEPNIEYKYNTVISLYYYKLLEIQVQKIENNMGANEEYNKILGERPTYENGRQLAQGFVINEGNVIQEGNNGMNNMNNINNINNEQNNNYKADSSLGGWFGYFGDKLNNATQYLGINNAINSVSNTINNSLEQYNLKVRFYFFQEFFLILLFDFLLYNYLLLNLLILLFLFHIVLYQLLSDFFVMILYFDYLLIYFYYYQ